MVQNLEGGDLAYLISNPVLLGVSITAKHAASDAISCGNHTEI